MEALIPLMMTAGISGGLLYAAAKNKDRREQFQDIIQPNVQKAFDPRHTQYVRDASSRFNPLMNLLNPQYNPLFPANRSTSEIAKNEKSVQNIVKAPLASPNKTGYKLQASNEDTLRINSGAGGPGFDAIKKCESVTNDSCDAFDDNAFNRHCGICHEEGVNSSGQPTLGGLFVTSGDKEDALMRAKLFGAKTVNYSPSVGTCKSNRFSTSKQQCQRIKNELSCLKSQAINNEGCSQCYQDESYQFIGNEIERASADIIVLGRGRAYIRSSKGESFNIELDMREPRTVPFKELEEGDVVTITVEPLNAQDPILAGYLEGSTASGKFTTDLVRLAQSDSETGARPRMSGFINKDDMALTAMRPGRGKTRLSPTFLNPFTFIQPFETEAGACVASPFITKSESAKFLSSGVCYKKGSGPGKYSDACLKSTFLSSGCSENGTGFPNSQEKMQQMMYFGGTTPLDIAVIAEKMNEISNSAYTGKSIDGNKLSIPQWNDASMFCTGKPITNPCDGDDKDLGPLSVECLDYIYQNKGATDKKATSLGPTYTNTPRTTSLLGQDDRFCTNKGTYSPILPDGKPNESLIQAAKGWGGVKNVKKAFNDAHLRANDNTLSDEQRKEAMIQCYGVDLIEDSSNKISNAICNMRQLISEHEGPSESKFYGNVTISKNWKLSFTVRPTKIHPVPTEWANLFVITGDETDYTSKGGRIPGVWFWPNTTRLHVSMLTGPNGWWNVDTSVSLPLDVDTNVTLTMTNGLLRLKTTGGVNEEVEGRYPVEQYTGPGKVFAPMKPWSSFYGKLTNVMYCSFSNFENTIDDRSGRTQSAQQEIRFDRRDLDIINKPISILARWGGGPWGWWWSPGFPDDGNANWIWNKPGALYDEPDWRYFKFMKIYTNPTNEIQKARLSVSIDNQGNVFVNDDVVMENVWGLQTTEVTFLPGENKIVVEARNWGGPAGFIAIARTDDKVLFVTDSSWKSA
jgi:hypothetical protein